MARIPLPIIIVDGYIDRAAGAVPDADLVDPTGEEIAQRGLGGAIESGAVDEGVAAVDRALRNGIGRADHERCRTVEVGGAVDESRAGDAGRQRRLDDLAVDIERQLFIDAAHGRGEVSPVRGGERPVYGLGALGEDDCAGVVVLHEGSAVPFDTEPEGASDIAALRHGIAIADKDRAFENNLASAGGELPRLDPGLDRPTPEGVATVGEADAGAGGSVAVEVKRLAQDRRIHVEGIGDPGDGRTDDFLLVLDIVVVGVVPLVDLEAEHEVGSEVHAGVGRHVEPVRETGAERGIGERPVHGHVAQVVVEVGPAVGVGGVGDPQRRGIGVVVGRFRTVRHQHLLEVGDAVLVGVGVLHPRQPGVRAEIVDIIRTELADQVANDGNLAQQRIEAMKHLVVVVHAVFVGVGQARVGAGVADGAVGAEGAELGLDEEEGNGGNDLHAILPVVGPGGPVPVQGNAGEDQHRIVCAVTQPGDPLVVLEVEDGVDPVFLVVLEAVGVEVEVPLDTGDHVGTALGVEIGAVHALGDARGRDVSGELELEAVGNEVHVGVDAAGVERAAGAAAADVAGVAVVVPEDAPLVAVADGIAVGVEIPGIGGPELVPPPFVLIDEAVYQAAFAGVKFGANHQVVAVGLEGGIQR